MTRVVEELGVLYSERCNCLEQLELGSITQPVFISVDPARDFPSAIRSYLSDFYPRLIGLTGTYDAIEATCKSYRVYFSIPKDSPDTDYLVDLRIDFYLMEPSGEFVVALGRDTAVDDVLGTSLRKETY